MNKNQPASKMIANKIAVAKTINAPVDANSLKGVANLVIDDKANKNTSIRGADASLDVNNVNASVRTTEENTVVSNNHVFFEADEGTLTTFPETNPNVPEGAMFDGRNFLKLLVKDTSASILSRDLAELFHTRPKRPFFLCFSSALSAT